jgi:hypothetical protein
MIKVGTFLAGLYILISLIIPIVLLSYPLILKHLVFMNTSTFIFSVEIDFKVLFVVKSHANLTQPETFGLDRVYNFYLNVEPQVSLGIWFVEQYLIIELNYLFRHFRSPLIEDQLYNDDEDYVAKHLTSTSKNIPIIIYLHGNAFDRY